MRDKYYIYKLYVNGYLVAEFDSKSEAIQEAEDLIEDGYFQGDEMVTDVEVVERYASDPKDVAVWEEHLGVLE